MPGRVEYGIKIMTASTGGDKFLRENDAVALKLCRLCYKFGGLVGYLAQVLGFKAVHDLLQKQ